MTAVTICGDFGAPPPHNKVSHFFHCFPPICCIKDTKVLSIPLSNQIQQCEKRMMHHDQAVFILETQVDLIFEKSINISHLNTD